MKSKMAGRYFSKFISQRLCTHSAFLFFHNPIFVMSKVFPGIGRGLR
jgi:hypothetical protein